VSLGRPGFDALTGLVGACPAVAMDYPDAATAIASVETLWEQLP
jgi:hypothetical protein